MPAVPARRCPARPRLSAAVLPLLLLGLAGPALAADGGGARPAAVDLGAYVARLYQRILALGTSIVDFENRLIFRLEQRRPVDFPRALARFRSAMRQILALRRTALVLEHRLPPGDPQRGAIETLKKRIPLIREAHGKSFARLKLLAGPQLAAADGMVGDACAEPPPPPPASFPVTSIDEQF